MSFRDFDKGIPAAQLREQHQREAESRRIQQQEQQQRELLNRFKESEHRLNILRTFTTGSTRTDEERMKSWLQTVIQKQ